MTIFQELPWDVLCSITIASGFSWHTNRERSVSIMSVCRATRDALNSDPSRFTELLLMRHETECAMARAAAKGREDILQLIYIMNGSAHLCSTVQCSCFGQCFDMNASGKEWALVESAKHGYIGIVRLLLDGPDPPIIDCLGGEAIISAAEQGHNNIIQFLLDRSDNVAEYILRSKESLIQAAQNGHIEIIMLAKGWWTKDDDDVFEWGEDERDQLFSLDRQNVIRKAMFEAKNANHYNVAQMLLKWLCVD